MKIKLFIIAFKVSYETIQQEASKLIEDGGLIFLTGLSKFSKQNYFDKMLLDYYKNPKEIEFAEFSIYISPFLEKKFGIDINTFMTIEEDSEKEFENIINTEIASFLLKELINYFEKSYEKSHEKSFREYRKLMLFFPKVIELIQICKSKWKAFK